MKYNQIQPPVFLKDYIQYFWMVEDNSTNTSLKTLGPLADGCPGIIFQQSPEGAFYDQEKKQLPRIFLYGQTITRTEVYLIGKFKTMGITFFPHALKSIFGFNAHELTDTCLDVNLLCPHLPEQLLNAPSTRDQIEIISSYLFNQIRKTNSKVDKITDHALAQIIESRGQLPLKELQIKLRLSERSFERKFNEHVGISPKMFSKICRFQAALRQLKSSQYTKLSEVAFDNGYSDQSHFIRSFKEFAGASPYQFRKQSNGSVENFPHLIK